jgi:hypothetical protein
VVLLGAAGFVVGVGLRIVLDAVGIALTNDFSFTAPAWARQTIPILFTTIGVLIGLVPQDQARRGPLRRAAVVLALGAAFVFGVVLLPIAASQQPVTVKAEADPTSSTALPVATTLRSDERGLYLQFVNFWNGSFYPTSQQVVSLVEAGEVTEARIECDLFQPRLGDFNTRITDWRSSDLRALILGMVEAGDRAMGQCSAGEWEEFAQSYELVLAYVERIVARGGEFSSREAKPDSD